MIKKPHPGWFQIELSLSLGIFFFFPFAASVVLLPGESPAGTKAVLFCGMGLGEERRKREGQLTRGFVGLAAVSGQAVWEVRTGLLKVDKEK